MRQRTIWMIIGGVAVALLLLCITLGAVGFFVIRQQERRLEAITSRINATIQAAATSSPTPRTTPTGVSTATTRTTPTARAMRTAEAEPSATASAAATGSAATTAILPPNANVDVAAALTGDSQDELAARPNTTLYQISATLDPAQHTIVGSQTVRLTNTEDTPLNEIYFRLYVNAPHYNEGEITVTDLRVGGTTAQPALEVDDTALKIPLAQPLQPGQSLEISLHFTTIVPTSGGGYGIFNEANGVFALYNWHPELAVYEKGGWLLNPVSDQGDPTNTDAANYEVTFAAPKAYTVVTSGVEVESAANADEIAHTIVAALTRNFVIVTSDRFQSATQQVGEVKVSSYYLPDDADGGKAALDTAAKSIELFSQQFGPYPYVEMDVAEVKLGGGAAGMESTGLVLIGSDYYDPQEANPLSGLGSVFEGGEGANVLAFTTAHEVAHQWWYGIVGSDAYKQPWLDESLTNWSSGFYVEQVAGEAAGALARDLFIDLPYREALRGGDQRLDQPVDQFDSQSYGSIVYGKGALMYQVLRAELGDERFLDFLQRYYQAQQFDRADSTEWLQALNQAAGKDMTPFYQKWVEGRNITERDLPEAGPLSNLLGNLPDALPTPAP